MVWPRSQKSRVPTARSLRAAFRLTLTARARRRFAPRRARRAGSVIALGALVFGVATHSWSWPASAAPGAAAVAAAQDAPPDVGIALQALVGDASFRSAKIGIAIVDIDSGKPIALHNEHGVLNPASNAKLYTAAASLAMLHGDHRFETTLAGTARDAAVAGPLVLRGYGDPSLSSEDLWAMAQELRGRGIRRIDGDILVDQSFFDETFTPPAFDQQPSEWAAFRAPVSALAINENTVTLAVRPGAQGQPASVTFDPPGFVDVDGVVTTAQSGADTVGLALVPAGKRLSAKVSGAVAEDARLVRYTRRVDDPSLLGGYVLRAVLDQVGIKVTGEVKAGAGKGGVVLARHQSEPLSSLLLHLGKQSDNFYAEMVFKSLGGERKARPARSENGADLITRWLERIGASDAGVVIKNGSGLFDSNRVTASSIVQLLRAAYRDPAIAPEFVSQLSIGGVDGTLHRRFASERARRSIRAKTGTLEDAIALSGYVLGPPGRGPIAFSILFNDVAGKAAGARAAADKLVELIARRLWSR